jgi:hypothetical protein
MNVTYITRKWAVMLYMLQHRAVFRVQQGKPAWNQEKSAGNARTNTC